MNAADHSLVFVGGLHRSGTSLLASLIARHPEASGFSNTGVAADEGQHLQDVYPTGERYGGPGQFAFAEAAHLTERSDLVSDENARRLLSAWSGHWDLTAPLLVEKSPPNLIRTRFLQALFPGSAFVVITRHPIPVALATSKWSRTSIGSLIAHWVTAHEIFQADRVHLERSLVLSYEELVSDTSTCLTNVFEFLGLEPVDHEYTARSGVNEKYFEQWQRLPRIRRATIVRRYQSRVSALGYSLLPDTQHEVH